MSFGVLVPVSIFLSFSIPIATQAAELFSVFFTKVNVKVTCLC